MRRTRRAPRSRPIARRHRERSGVARWDRATDRVITLTDDWAKDIVIGFTEDAGGDLWIGMVGHLVRVHDGKATATASPVGEISAILIDHRGRLWLATAGEGVARIDDPERLSAMKCYRSTQLGSSFSR